MLEAVSLEVMAEHTRTVRGMEDWRKRILNDKIIKHVDDSQCLD